MPVGGGAPLAQASVGGPAAAGGEAFSGTPATEWRCAVQARGPTKWGAKRQRSPEPQTALAGSVRKARKEKARRKRRERELSAEGAQGFPGSGNPKR